MPTKLNHIAVLIDADNASSNNIGRILKEIEKLGNITCKKLYGDWSSTHLHKWRKVLLKYAIEPIQQFAYVKGKNATDIGLVVEAMDLLYSKEYDGFCLISSDSDFTSLALRIRKDNVKVFGFGRRNTVDAFTQACDQFFFVEDLSKKQIPKVSPNFTKTKASEKQPVAYNQPKSSKEIWDGNRLKCDAKLLNSLFASIIDHPKAEEQRWVNIALVGSEIKKYYANFSPTDYGYSKLTNIIKNIDVFETKKVDSILYVRHKDSAATVSKVLINPLSSTASNSGNAKESKRWTTKQLRTQTHFINVLNKLITEDPKSDNGWSNISYIASQVRQHHDNIKLDKYGYKKFSDLITALDIYEMRRENNKIFIKRSINNIDT